MNKQIKSLVAATALTISAGAPLSMTMGTAPAQAHGNNCKPIVARLLRTYRHYRVHGSGVIVRDGSGSQFFTMSPNYKVESGLANRTARARSSFRLSRHSSGKWMTGKFGEVFPKRGNGDEDLSTLRIHKSGLAQVKLNTWKTGWINLRKAHCLRLTGQHGKQFILFGTHGNSRTGSKTYSFVVTPQRR